MSKRFPKEAPHGFMYLHKGLHEELVPYRGFEHFFKILDEKSQFVEQYVSSGKMEKSLNIRVLIGPGEICIVSQFLDVRSVFDYASPKNDKKPLLDWLEKTLLPILEKMKEVTPDISVEVDAFVKKQTESDKTLLDLIEEVKSCCSGAQGGFAAVSAKPDSESDDDE
jgi:hypothetical protein